jgi:hypothetical protein
LLPRRKVHARPYLTQHFGLVLAWCGTTLRAVNPFPLEFATVLPAAGPADLSH